MDPSNFDELTRSLASGRSRRSILRGLVGGGAALAAMRTGSSLAAPAQKVSICHVTGNGSSHLITVSANAIPAHEAHGDGYLGTAAHCSACGDTCEAVDACTPALCTDDGCNATSDCDGNRYCGGGGCCDDIALGGVEGCFWMQDSGYSCWVPTGNNFGDCRALDSCSETGGGETNGCYKWATSSSDPGSAPPWF